MDVGYGGYETGYECLVIIVKTQTTTTRNEEELRIEKIEKFEKNFVLFLKMLLSSTLNFRINEQNYAD